MGMSDITSKLPFIGGEGGGSNIIYLFNRFLRLLFNMRVCSLVVLKEKKNMEYKSLSLKFLET